MIPESLYKKPYVGSRSFEKEDYDIFYGRDNEAKDIVSLIIANSELLIYSPSGAGKTSLLNARVIPMLEKEGFEVFPKARVQSGQNIITTLDEKSYLFNWDNVIGIDKEKLFSFIWDKVPGDDNERLIGFLKDTFGIDWVMTAKVEKIDDGKTIRVSTENNLLSLKLNDGKTKVNLRIDDGRTDEFIVKIMENRELKIYEKLLYLLRYDFNVKWIEENASIKKIDNDRAIQMSMNDDSIEIRIDEKNENVILKIIHGLQVKKAKYFFSWDETSGKGAKRLTELLKQKFGIDWVKTAKIRKSDFNTIDVYTIGKSFSLILNDEKTKVTLNIDNIRKYEFDVMNDKGKLYIYEEIEKRNNNEKSYMFGWNEIRGESWDEIPRKNIERLEEFLRQKFDIAWVGVETTKIEKTYNTIDIYTLGNYLSLRLNDEKTKVNLRIDDGRTDEFDVVTENGMLNIYKENGKSNIYDESYLFNWDDVTGIDKEKFFEFLRDNFNIRWIEKNAKISKSNDDKIICLSRDEDSVEIMTDENNENATLIIIHGLRVKKENDKVNIYEKSNIFIFSTLTRWDKSEQLVKMSLASFLKKHEHKLDDDGLPLPRAIIFDQFEELFTWYPEKWKDREGFFRQVSEALENDPLLRVVFVMREDHIAKLDPYVSLLPENLRTRFRIDRLQREAAIQAIKGPLNNTNISFEENVAEKLVDDLLKMRIEIETPGKIIEVSGEFAEGLQLQVVCDRFWQQLQKLPEYVEKITLYYLNKYGNVETALSEFYDEAVHTAVKETSHVDEESLRKWFEEVLITSMGTRGTVCMVTQISGGLQTAAGIPSDVIDILESKYYLIRAEPRAGARWYELSHDKFIEPIQKSNRYYRLKTSGTEEKEEKLTRISKVVIAAEQAWGAQKYEEAIKNYIDALGIYKEINDPSGQKNTLFNLGRIYSEMREYEKATGIYQEVIEIDPNNAWAHNNYALLLEERDRPIDAEEHYERAIETDPKLAEAHFNYALLLEELNRKDEAEKHHEKIRELGERCIDVSLEVSRGLRNLKILDICGTQAYEGYNIIGFVGKEFEFSIDKCLTLNLTMKVEKDTDTCLLLMVHDKSPDDHVNRFVVIGKTLKGNPWVYDVVNDCFIIKDDEQWHDYAYGLKSIKEKYPNAETIRVIQFYSYREYDVTLHAFNIRRLLIK